RPLRDDHLFLDYKRDEWPWLIDDRLGIGCPVALGGTFSTVAEKIMPVFGSNDMVSAPRTIFTFLRAGYSTHKRFVLGGDECAPLSSSRTAVTYNEFWCRTSYDT